MGSLRALCVILSMYMYCTFGKLSLIESKASDRNGLLPSSVSGKASNVLRDILNQESLVRFSMVQKIQNLFMEAIDNKNDRQIMKTKLSEVAKELQDLETKSQIMEEENVKLKEELKVLYGAENENRNLAIKKIERLNQTEIFFLKNQTLALKEKNNELTLKNADFQKQFVALYKTMDLLNVTYEKLRTEFHGQIQEIKKDITKNRNNTHTVNQMQNDFRKDLQTLKITDQRTLEKIKSLNESQLISFKSHLQKMAELDDYIRNESLTLKDNDRLLNEEVEVLKYQMIAMNTSFQKSGVDVLTGPLKTTEDMFKSFSVSVNETLDNVREDLNETIWRLSEVSFDLLKVPTKDCSSCWDILKTFPSLKGRDGVYTIFVASTVKSVYCDMSTDGGGWTAIQRRQDGSTDFYRTWRDYKQGFGDPSKNYWIGNDAIYELTKNKDQELRVELQSFDGAEAYAQYSTFYVGDESSKYRLTVSGYSGTAGDSLNYHNGRRFSTKDKDNDDNRYGNCAKSDHGAWWYGGCAYSNLNGEYARSALPGSKYTSWWYWRKTWEALQKTKMMIRKNVI